jgi:predicted transcriptional regulator
VSTKTENAFEDYVSVSTILLGRLVAKEELVHKKAMKAFFKSKDAELDHYRAIVKDTLLIDVCRLRLLEIAIVSMPLRKKPDHDLGAWLLRKLVEVYSTVEEHDRQYLGSPIEYYEKVLIERGMMLRSQTRLLKDDKDDKDDEAP